MNEDLVVACDGDARHDPFDGITFKVATEGELAKVFALRHEVYQEALGHVPSDNFDAGAYHMLAIGRNDDALATFRLVAADQRPFDIESSVNLDAILGLGRSPALVGRLCVRNDCRNVSRSSFLLMGMIKLAYRFALKYDITDYFLYTYDNLRIFYRGLLFRDLNLTFNHQDWGPVYLFHLNIDEVSTRRLSAPQAAFERFLFEPDHPRIVL